MAEVYSAEWWVQETRSSLRAWPERAPWSHARIAWPALRALALDCGVHLIALDAGRAVLAVDAIGGAS